MEDEIPDEIAPELRCSAGGCPLLGALKHGIGAGGDWYCRHHYRALPRQWSVITGAIYAARRDGQEPDGYVRQALRQRQKPPGMDQESDVAVL